MRSRLEKKTKKSGKSMRRKRQNTRESVKKRKKNWQKSLPSMTQIILMTTETKPQRKRRKLKAALRKKTAPAQNPMIPAYSRKRRKKLPNPIPRKVKITLRAERENKLLVKITEKEEE